MKYSMGMVAKTQPQYGRKIAKLTSGEIKRIVENSQRIEGYEPASQEEKVRIRSLMDKNNVKVSIDSDHTREESYLKDWDWCDA